MKGYVPSLKHKDHPARTNPPSGMTPLFSEMSEKSPVPFLAATRIDPTIDRIDCSRRSFPLPTSFRLSGGAFS